MLHVASPGNSNSIDRGMEPNSMMVASFWHKAQREHNNFFYLQELVLPSQFRYLFQLFPISTQSVQPHCSLSDLGPSSFLT